jgi:hypothetical protein
MKKRKISSSETDDNIDELDDSDNDIYNKEYDGLPNLDDISHLTSLYNSLLSAEKSDVSTIPPVDKFSSDSIRSAFEVSSSSSSITIASSLIFDDSIRSYIEAPTLFQPTVNLSPYYSSIDSIVNQLNPNPLASDKLYVGNINYEANLRDLKEFFINLGYKVIRVDLPKNHNAEVDTPSLNTLIYFPSI